jgi:hypothetical protein
VEDPLRPRTLSALRLPPLLAGAAALLAGAAAAAAAEPWQFDWGDACRLPVTERIERAGRGATSSFVLDVRRAAQGFEVRFTDFQMLGIEGLASDDPRTREVLERTGRRAAALLPVLRVDAGGRYAGITRFDELIENVAALQGGDPAAAERTRRTLASPRMRAQLEQTSSDYWSSWVGSWLGLGLAPGQAREDTSRLPVPGGSLPLATRLEHRGAPPHAPARAQLALHSRTTPADVKDTLAAIAAELGPERPAGVEDLDARFERSIRVEADVEPEGLRPHRVRVATTTEFGADGESHRRSDVRDDTFHWDRAQGCGR